MDKEHQVPLATEIIRTLKKIIYFLLLLELLTIAGFVWYISLPVEETQTITQDQDGTDVDNSTLTQKVGD